MKFLKDGGNILTIIQHNVFSKSLKIGIGYKEIKCDL